jgi:four helix bundle protein
MKIGDGRSEIGDRASMTSPIEKFEDLQAWQEARILVQGVYTLTRQPDLAKDYGLKDQIRRASVSVMSNIAEGFERKGVQEKLNFYNIARASCAEVRSLLYVILDNYPTLHHHIPDLHAQAKITGRLISGLHSSTQKRLAFTTLFCLLGITISFFAMLLLY